MGTENKMADAGSIIVALTIFKHIQLE